MINSILVIADKESVEASLKQGLVDIQNVTYCKSLWEKKTEEPDSHYDVLFIDIDQLSKNIPTANNAREAKALFRQIQNSFPNIEIVVMAPGDRIRETINYIRAGAITYLTYPIDRVEIQHVLEFIQDNTQIQLELDYLRDQFWQSDSHELIRTNSPNMQNVFNKVRTVAAKKVTVLLTGETGTGKGVIARLIHRHSKRNSDQFIGVHCGAIPDTLLESELFGHEKGAFTGASQHKLGKFDLANGGTIFLDEIGTITPSMQVKLLQVLQEGVIQRIGSDNAVEVNVRIIAATNEDLNQRRIDGTFRGDLFYRLNVFPIELPPLRDRLEDINILVETFLARFNSLYGKEISYIHRDVLDAFKYYDWPGNIRELENLIERAHLIEETDTLMPDSFPQELFAYKSTETAIPLKTDLPLAEFRKTAFETLEYEYIKDLLTGNHGVIKACAAHAGITTRQFGRLMKKHGFSKETFKAQK